MIRRVMLDEIIAWLEGGEKAPPRGGTDEVQLAAAALLIEAAHIDDHDDARERAVIDGILERRFKLSPAAARQLVAAAERVSERSTQLFRFTHVINDRFSLEQRIELMEMLWEVVYADGAVDALEDTLLRRVGGLLYIPDRERGAARQRVLQRRQGGEPAEAPKKDVN
jgi:uncharacterized tellurite resistance protein B-like protein